MKRRGIAVLVLSICVVAIAAFGLWSANDQTLSADNGSTTKWVTGSTPESEARAAEEAQGSDDIVTMLMDQQKKNEDIAKKTDQKDTSKKSNDSKKKDSDTIIEETKEDQKDPEKPFDQEHSELMDQVEYSAETLMLKFKKPFDGKVDTELKRAGVAKLDVLFEMEDHIWYTAYLKKTADVDKTLENVREIKKIAVAEYNYKYETAETTAFDTAVEHNPNSGEQHHHKKCHIKEAWKKAEDDKKVGGGSSNVVVAVIDTGVDYNHEDLKANMWYNSKEVPNNNIDDDGNGYVDDYYGVDMTADDGSSSYNKYNGSGMDDNGHGTHVAGIIAASNNKTGVVGIAYNTKIMAIKAGDASGYFQASNIAEAILYAYDHGADVINMSFGGSASTIAVQDALATAYSRCTLVAAAGNSAFPNEPTDYYPIPAPSYPAAFSYVLGVMSVDQNNVESSFTNWDAKLYNSYEYEVYAPGNQILSTIPGDRYAKMSGTSMASPVVAAQAAMLRSYYDDANKYPTKFIYGQIVGTADNEVQCINPAKHTVNGYLHNIPGVVNFYDSINELPTPDIGMSDYTLFDTEEFVADTKGITEGKVDKNNGDGIVDAGETIALGFTLKNRWGMSEDTVVSINATNNIGVTNPYVTFLNNDINYGSIGTYSESDSGKLYSEDGEMWNGWENPFYIKIADNCPNDYSVTLNVNITYKNGLDESDTTTYKDEAAILLTVRRGVELPNKITEDTVLTKDNYYIIPNSMTVMEGATLTIKEGTQVQFWCSDPQDSYADTAITYLKVNGKLICEGTEKEPIEMFPSGWMDRYRVEIYTAGDGYASLKYTNVINPYLAIDKAENCEFTQNYKDYIYYRYLDSGSIKEHKFDAGDSVIKMAVDCVFYKMGGSYNDSGSQYRLRGEDFQGCLFVDSQIWYNIVTMNNCVFYGNNNYWDNENKGGVSSLTVSGIPNDIEFERVFKDSINGKTYMTLYMGDKHFTAFKEVVGNCKVFDSFAKKMGGELLSINTSEEYNIVNKGIASIHHYMYGYYYDIEDNAYYNFDGSEFINEIEISDRRVDADGYVDIMCFGQSEFWLENNTGDSASNSLNRYILEFVDDIFISDIQLEEYVVNLDTVTPYQIEATVTPTTADATKLVYESQDETVATVDENGLITPVGQGSTDIRVYAPDRAVYNYVTVNVAEEVIPTAIKAKKDEITLAVGETKRASVEFTPTNATKKTLTYESEDPKVATVNERGVIKAEAVGETTITITGYDGIKTTVKVNCVIPAESIAFAEDVYVTTMDKEDGTDFYPIISPADSTQTELKWTSSNPEVCYVDENGKLVKLQEGTAGLKAALVGTDLSAIVTVAISPEEIASNIVKMAFYENYKFALMENNTLWVWGGGYKYPKQMLDCKVKDFVIDDGHNMFILDDNNKVKHYHTSSYNDFVNMDLFSESNILKDIIALSTEVHESDTFFAITDEGSVWAWGSNVYGQLGDGTTTDATYSNPVQVDFTKSVKKIITMYNATAFLTTEGELYVAGDGKYLTPDSLCGSVKNIFDGNANDLLWVDLDDECGFVLASDLRTIQIRGEKVNDTYKYAYHQSYIEEGKVYIRDGFSNSYYNNSEYKRIENVNNAKEIFDFGNNIYIQTIDGKFYAAGYGSNYALGNASINEAEVPVRVYFGLAENSSGLAMQDWNISVDESENNILIDNEIVLDYNQMLEKGNYYGHIKLQNGSEATLTFTKAVDMDKLTIEPKSELVVGETYTLTIPEGALTDRTGSENEETVLTFIYQGDSSTGNNEGVDEEGDSIGDLITDGEEIVEEEKEVHDTAVDDEKMAARDKWTEETVTEEWEKFVAGGHNTRFYSNVILNRLNDDDTSTWLRITAPDSSDYQTISLGGNYWGTTNKKLIDKQILDYDDFGQLADINEGEILTEAPSNTYPFVVDAYLEMNGEKTDTVGNDLVTFVVDFNRAMDTSIDLSVQFGSAYPYADYTVEGEWATDKQWRGEMQLTTIIENGYQYWSVSNGKAAGTSLKLYKDWGRFPFMIDTSAAQSLLMDGEATETGIKLTWEQDDFETLAGYNVYRSEEEDGQYKKLNTTVIPADNREWFDETVYPGQKYYYNFTVVQTDLTESEPSGKVIITAMDTMAPGIYHDPVFHAFTGSNLVISAVVNDNVKIDKATLYYRTKGASEWKSKDMTNNNDKYSAVISASEVTVDGIEYYIEATDGISTTNKGTADEPIEITVQVAVAASEKGDVDGNGAVELKDAMMVLMAINDRYNMTEEEFARADLDDSGVLEAKEALRILQYVNGSIGSIL